MFLSLGCRFIALNDGVDTLRKNNEMLVILKNVMNDLYARDTSSKIKAVKLSTFKSGKYVGCYAPLGYRKSEADKHVLEIDPVTAPVVRHIFDLRLQGYGFRKIALQLNAEKVPAPRSFYYMAEGRENLRGETPFWNDVTVKAILRNEVYIGHMVQNKTGTVSYKNHKQVSKPESEWIKVENTHEPLRTQLLAREQNASVEHTRTLQAELNAIGKRLPDLDKLIQSAYEDKVLGCIPESVCVNLLNQYEAERREKQERHKELTGQLAASRETESSVDAWLDMMQDYAQLEELDRPTLVRLIQKIEISERYTVDDHAERDIHIYYNFVGYIEA